MGSIMSCGDEGSPDSLPRRESKENLLSSESPMHTVFVTGANSGLGYESCRQLAVDFGVSKIYLGCRNDEKARAAIEKLVQETGRDESTFEFVRIDTTDLDSCREAATAIAGDVTGVILNAGGTGGPASAEKLPYGATKQFAMNFLGHAVLMDALIENDKLADGARIVFAGSELGRGLAIFGVAEPVFDQSDLVGDFASRIDGSGYESWDGMAAYADVKCIGALYMAYMARGYPQFVFITMSPGGTSGTSGADNEPWYTRLFVKTLGPILIMHSLPEGALRYMAALGVSDVYDIKASDTGAFFASIGNTARGPIEDQGQKFAIFRDEGAQDAAYEAVRRFTS